ncbi:MAG: DNA repair protein RecN [Elusimicrobia bacterium]|nr:DNA repair protein RecN [Elusimicrobiota bacterium]MDE2236282.1 DNA repair protein RecN [Elusimicrobiota bacterium]MDE2426560.1 DNA repair protein RecN [Elusimicrobiota bacterium]
MIHRLQIKNFAIIEDETLELKAGLNVLTGETGAGKSILVEALGFLLGARASSSWLRAGASKLEVTGWFDAKAFPEEVTAQFKVADSPVMVRRELDAGGRSRAIINSQTAPAAALAALGGALVDFHGQHEHQTLLKPAVQLELLDRFGAHDAALERVRADYARWRELKERLDSSRMSEEERRKRVEAARFQLQELSEARLRPGEEEELEAALPRLKNAERLKGLAAAAYESLYEQEGAALSTVLRAQRALCELSRIDSSTKPLCERLEQARLSLEELAHEAGGYRDRLQTDPAALDAILSRLDVLSRLKKKYGPTVGELIALREKTAAELESLEGSQKTAEEIERSLSQAERRLGEACEKIHALRRRAAGKLEALVLAQLKELGMPNAAFSVAVELEEGHYGLAGADAVEFLLAPNPGEPLRSVRSIASGGELSRVMLALKTVFAEADQMPTLVFDEVDAGVGGAVARSVGERLAALGRARQVLCVTHLPQVACFAGAHFLVSKRVVSGRTRAAVEHIDGARRLEALALMLGGREATAASRKHAMELLEASAPS